MAVRKRAPARRAGPVEAAVKRDLARLPVDLARSALGASALALAMEMDTAKNSATSKSMCARALLDTLDRLLELAPAADERDGLDDLAARRAVRIGSAAATG